MEQMEDRKCACGCGTTFRVMVASHQRYASMAHEAPLKGGLMTLMTNRRKKNGFKLIPPDLHGLVGSEKLAEILGCSYQTVYNRMKAGHITPVEGAGRNKQWDLDQVRAQLGQSSEPLPPSRHNQNTPEPQEEPEMTETEDQTTDLDTPRDPREAPQSDSDQQGAPDYRAVIQSALTRARRTFKKHLKAAIEQGAGGDENELVLLRMHLRSDDVFDYMRKEMLG